MAQHNDLGKLGESLAVQYLTSKGYVIIAQNWRFSYAEIDIIALFQSQLIFVEVKTRTSNIFGFPENFVDLNKERLLAAAAEEFIYRSEHKGECRFDIISITFKDQTNYNIEHFEDAFFPR